MDHHAAPGAPDASGGGNGIAALKLDTSAEGRAQQLAGMALFRGMDVEHVRLLGAAAEVVSFGPTDRIVTQGEPGESVYLILDGRVEVLARVTVGDVTSETVIAWMAAGDALGELSLLDGQPRSATCVAVTPVTALRLGREPFLAAVRQNWSLGHALYAVLAQRIRLADSLLAEHSRDPLTGLNNRRALSDLYERETMRVQRLSRQHGLGSVQPLAVIFADVNRFKAVNDTYGHHVGDEVLKAIARTLTGASRTTDLVARYGGDEFVVLLPEAGTSGVEVVVNRIRSRLAEQPPGPVPFGVSLGHAVVDSMEPQPLDVLLAEADAAMFRDKRDLANGGAGAAGANGPPAARRLRGLLGRKVELQ
jgi:diguanylate cyclase (GGDEF)-like protein